MASQNLGQVAGLWIGTSAPTNTTLIWYDSTPAIRCHKVYSVATSAWVVLDQNTISAITYSVLKNLAQGTGLTQGSWYKIIDQGNILALAITTTKVQYADVNSNFIIDDLAASKTYLVSSDNLLIDDIVGVWDATNKKLKFSFDATSHDGNTDNDYLFGKKQRNNVWSLAKYKLSELVSSVTGNALSWNKGIFFNFNSALANKTDVSGGVVGKTTYDSDKATMQQSISNVAASNQAILNTAKNYTDTKVTPSEVYGKVLPTAPTAGTAVDIAVGDTLTTIVNKIHRWIAQFKIATGIKVSQSFAPASSVQAINNNDTVDSALRKVQKSINDVSSLVTGEDAKVGTTDVQVLTSEPTAIVKTDTIKQALQKLVYWVTHVSTSRINDGAVSLAKIARYGVLPTDIFRVDLHTSFDMSSSAIGCVLVQGASNQFFGYDQHYPDNPYRLTVFYRSDYPKILAFCPVTRVVTNDNYNYSVAAPFVHFTEEGITCQFIVYLSQDTYDTLYNSPNNFRYLKGTITADVYNDEKSAVNFSIEFHKVNILNINFQESSLIVRTFQHIILKVDMTASTTA